MDKEPTPERRLEEVINDLIIRLRQINLLVTPLDEHKSPWLLAITNTVTEEGMPASDEDIEDVLAIFRRQNEHLSFSWDKQGLISIDRIADTPLARLLDRLNDELASALETSRVGYTLDARDGGVYIYLQNFQHEQISPSDLINTAKGLSELLKLNEAVTSDWEVVLSDPQAPMIELRPIKTVVE